MPNLNDSLGPIVCGAFVCTMFFGAITLQLGHYLRNYYREDRVYVRATVLFLYVVHIAFTICICHTAYIMAVTDFGQLGITNHAVQGFLVFQIYRATRQLYLCIVLWTLDVLIESLALYLCVEFFRTRSIPIIVSNPTFEHWFLVLFVGDAALDWVNASVLCYYLWRQRKRAFSTSTSTLVDQLLVYTLQTGLSTRSDL
uniref:DUF6534 domain-containing protein n=1 Tax=Mycena chlorophos TaxID=658473 RepID=A0ABQ0LPH0_MYCCL|nr:predicted protein [Mycena chlorophos]